MLLAILAAVIAGQSIAAVLSGVSLVGWLGLVVELAEIPGEGLSMMKGLHWVFDEIHSHLNNGVPHEEIAKTIHAKMTPVKIGGPSSDSFGAGDY
jgi:hypothetical protein